MSNYIDENYYYNTYKGKKISRDKFNEFATKASDEVRIRIFNKPIIGYEKEVQTATCLVAEILYNQSLKKAKMESILNGTEKLITSEKVGDYSRNISAVSLADLRKDCESIDKEIDNLVERKLLFTGLLYTGVRIVR